MNLQLCGRFLKSDFNWPAIRSLLLLKSRVHLRVCRTQEDKKTFISLSPLLMDENECDVKVTHLGINKEKRYFEIESAFQY